MSNKFGILVSSCDAYEDCWKPFFTLFDKYWPHCDIPMVLNTETKTFTYPGLNIICPTPCKTNRRKCAWGQRLLKCLDFIEPEIVLMMLDDFFIKAPVQVEKIYELVDLMYRDDLSHILLADAPGPNKRSKYPLLLERGQFAPYRISLQVGLWRKSHLSYYVREHENSWQTELWGTRRAWRVKDAFFCLDQSLAQTEGKIIDYDDSGGNTQGKWIERIVVDLFKKHNIEVDFSVRGFYNNAETIALSKRLEKRLHNLPSNIRSLLDLYLLIVCILPRVILDEKASKLTGHGCGG